jgi:DNA invertase Pin-like site-specific DNA recombinase
MKGKLFSYLRVSTDKQGEHGCGIDAQRHAVANYLKSGTWELLDEFVEVESGKRKDRPKLAEALAACKKHKARLVIAKLDRLARNVHLISGLMESKVDFVCCDMPDANRLTIHILAAVAEHERDMISKRTKDGLTAAKAKGVKLGNTQLAAKNRAAAHDRAEVLRPAFEETSGLSARKAAAVLNGHQAPTPTGRPWSAKTVLRVRTRLGLSPPGAVT